MGEPVTNHAEADEQAVSDHADRRASDRRRAAKLRERREQAGQVRISAWVPRERAAYARQVLQAAAAGANALPPDPGQQADLDAARAETAAARAELEEARAAASHQVEQARSAEAGALARAEMAERDREGVARELTAARAEVETIQGRERATQEAAEALRGELKGIRSRGGWRGVLLRLVGA